MKHRIAAWIVRKRKLILLLMLVLAAAAVFGIPLTRINYDLNRYLSDDTMTKRSLQVMTEEFGSSEQLRVMFADLPEEELTEAAERLNAMPEVLLAAHDPEKDRAERDGVTYQLINLTLNECDTAKLVTSLRAMFPEKGRYWVGGSAANVLDVQKSVGAEIPLVMAISVAVVLLVLLLTSHAWLEPVILLITLGISILINLGTNFIFPDVSFITFAVSAILQLALSIDYAIMLIHTWNDETDAGKTPEEAMTDALEECFMRIASSAFTTVAGLLSLLFMSFTIGFDIGLVLSKGILISMLGVFLYMPALILLFGRLLRKTRHKPLRLGGDKLAAALYRARVPVTVVLAVCVGAGVFLHSRNVYTFSENAGSVDATETGRIGEIFGNSSPLVILVPGGNTDGDYGRQRELAERIRNVRVGGDAAVTEITAMVTTGEMAVRYYSPADLSGMTGIPEEMALGLFEAKGWGESVRGDAMLSDMAEMTADEVSKMTGLPPFAVGLFFSSNGYGETVETERLLADAGSLSSLAGGVLPAIPADAGKQLARLRTLLDTANTAFHGKNYDRMLLTLSFPPSDSRSREAVQGVLDACRAVYGDHYYVTGFHMSTYDIGNAFQGDLLKVNIVTFLAILMIVALSFRSLKLPLVLVFVIEGAIWVTMGMSALTASPIFFISYLICVSIQMGATIDYGILLSDQYRSMRLQGTEPREAIISAMKRTLPTVLTSGTILTTAGYIVGKVSTIFYISNIGALLARGTLVSVFLVLTLLPALLTLLDQWIIRVSPGRAAGKDQEAQKA